MVIPNVIPISKRIFVFILILHTCFLFGCSAILKQGVTPEGIKVYLGPTPIESTPAYENFLRSSKSETAKLYYLLDRIKDSKDLAYYFEGSRYSWMEAYAAGTWVLWRHYKKGENAKSFLRREVSRYPGPAQTAYIKFPDGLSHLTYHVLVNELELLDQTHPQNMNSNSTSKNKF